ncbi:hypothetical protein H1P_310026 [Hyella patelloides LEGE 07179]|uniref:Uncharacterized protein n=1 Tax=Hyella patelloides LEGE 07179 TaxID=945734 RepID=A0A563VUQ3_9CYAN|nr:formylglycine-generating enzyme family protein [Hyella patelloides]VEP15125.1 hypothetical protein H1P_310026 [Hyella patelloides LEGE 07179]
MSKKTKREYRLPTEAEEEYGCRGVDPFIYLQRWVMGKKSPATKVRIKRDDFLISETPVNLSRPDVTKAYHLPRDENKGFKLDFNVMGVPPQTILSLEMGLQDYSQVTMAIIKVIPQ